MYNKLPELDKNALPTPWFPTTMQAFIFRNWHSVDKAILAKVLGTTCANVETEAERMGLGEQDNTSTWAERGYITIIRNNWHILDYDQLLELLDFTEDKLAHILKEDDFLEIKLGKKPICKKIKYTPLTCEQISATEKAFKTIKNLTSTYGIGAVKPFDFWHTEPRPAKRIQTPGQVTVDNSWTILSNLVGSDEIINRFKSRINYMWGIQPTGNNGFILINSIENKKDEYHEIIVRDDKITINVASLSGLIRALYRLEDISVVNGGMHFDKGVYKRTPRFDARLIYSFSALYETALDVDSRYWCPDELLERYASVGINGIWLQAVLYRLTPFPFDEAYSHGWKNRIERLKDFCERAGKYGIKIYLYLNEPRCMPIDFFDKYPDLLGGISGKYGCMCMSSAKVQNYLHNAIKLLCTYIPSLGGFFTISMSENPTHCKSRPEISLCPHCNSKTAGELVNLVNKTIALAAQEVNPDIKLIGWDWGWDEEHGMNRAERYKALDNMPANLSVMATREDRVNFNRGGIDNTVIDYSISVEGIGNMSKEVWSIAKEQGCKTAVKLQINNTWECSTTPYIPVYKTLISHMNNAISIGAENLMLSWTLGGYPSPSIKLLSEAFFIENDNPKPNYKNALISLYGDSYRRVKKATDIFCDAFAEFPNNLDVLYLGPQNGGVSNLFYPAPTDYHATMTGFAYDALDDWRGNYPREVFKKQFKSLADKWGDGITLLNEADGEIYDISYICYSLFKSSYNQINFILQRNSDKINEIIIILQNELELAKNVYRIMSRHSEIGYEAANHYYYNTDNILEKVVNCEYLIKHYQNKP